MNRPDLNAVLRELVASVRTILAENFCEAMRPLALLGDEHALIAVEDRCE